MASEKIKLWESIFVSISAPTITLMLYDNCNSDDQTGFLLGEIFRTEGVVRERNRDGVLVDIKTYKFHIRIQGAIVCPEVNLYNANFTKESIPKIPNIVGWFTRRELITTNPINPLRLTFTEKLIHKNLVNKFKEWPFFTGCVLNTSNNYIKNVHGHDFKFFQLSQEKRFLEVEIDNSILDLKSYQSQRFVSWKVRKNFTKSYLKDGSFQNNFTQEEIDKSINELVDAESQLFILLKEIEDISKDIEQLQKDNKTQKQQKDNKTQKPQKQNQIQKKNKIKPYWIVKLEEKHLYQNSKSTDIPMECH